VFLRCHRRKKDGKIHRYWSIVESRRTSRGPVQRHVLYLGEINDSQLASWEKAITVFDEQHAAVFGKRVKKGSEKRVSS
jgi:hypothetical protein